MRDGYLRTVMRMTTSIDRQGAHMSATARLATASRPTPSAGESLQVMGAQSATEPLRRASLRLLGGRREVAIVREAQRGSERALEELFRRHWRRAHRAAYLVVGDSAAAEDIAQESFLAAIRALDRFDRRRPFGPWLHRITVNRAIDYARARRLRSEGALPREAEGEAPAGPELSDELVAALAGLSPEHRALVVLRHLLEYTPGEIARMLDLPRGTVNSRLRRALDRLRPAIEREER
jgi:RNA polymerase sigma-70 factor (ECF subfamily)